MAEIKEKTVQAKYVESNNDFYIIWWNPALKLLSKDDNGDSGITKVSKGKIYPGQAEAITIYADSVKQACQDKIDELGLT